MRYVVIFVPPHVWFVVDVPHEMIVMKMMKTYISAYGRPLRSFSVPACPQALNVLRVATKRTTTVCG